MSYNADLASYAENHPDDFIDADYTKFLNMLRFIYLC